MTNSTVLISPVLAARLVRVPVLIQAQEAVKSVAARRIFRFHGAVANVVIIIARFQEAALGRRRRARVALIPVGIPVGTPAPPVRNGFGSPVQLCLIGTVDRHKRQDLAVDTVAMLQDRGIATQLKLVGPIADPDFAAEVRQRARRLGVSESVQMAGPTASVETVYHESDILLLPAGEVTPLVLMEALAHETPTVAADMGAVSDIVVDGVTGVLVPSEDPTAMADAVVRLLSDPGYARRLAAAGRLHVARSFDETASHEHLRAEIERALPIR